VNPGLEVGSCGKSPKIAQNAKVFYHAVVLLHSKILLLCNLQVVPWLRRLVVAHLPWKPEFAPGSVGVELWSTKWHWYKCFSRFFGFFLSVSFHRASSYSCIIWEMNIKPVWDCSSETQSHSIAMKHITYTGYC
jgi:hypothetical protein